MQYSVILPYSENVLKNKSPSYTASTLTFLKAFVICYYLFPTYMEVYFYKWREKSSYLHLTFFFLMLEKIAERPNFFKYCLQVYVSLILHS